MALDFVLSWFLKKRQHQIDLFKKYPLEVQQEIFTSHLQNGANTEYGSRFNFSQIKDSATFAKEVPIVTYENLQPYIQRCINGEQKILWPSEIKWFAKSSGTTSSKSKFIPVSKEALEQCHYRGGKDLLALFYTNKPQAKIYTGKCLVIGGSSQLNENAQGSYFGDLSAIIIRNLPYWVEYKTTPNQEIALMDQWEDKIERMAQTTIQEDVTNMAGVPSWSMVLIKRILEITGKQNIMEVWPNFQLYMHGGVSFNPYRDWFAGMMPPDQVTLMESYNASEGYFGIQDRLDNNDLLLMLDYGIYYEFIPKEEWDKEHPEVISLQDVELNTPYAIVISTNGGLWRYKVGDTLQFTSRAPYRFKLLGRTKLFINAFGEELIIDNAEQAIAKAASDTGCLIKEYSAAPIFMDTANSGGHEWVIEFEKEPENLVTFATSLDQHLKAINSDYEAKRSFDLSLAFPKITLAPKNTFYLWLKSKGKLGGQHKVPRLSNDRSFIEDILTFIADEKTNAHSHSR